MNNELAARYVVQMVRARLNCRVSELTGPSITLMVHGPLVCSFGSHPTQPPCPVGQHPDALSFSIIALSLSRCLSCIAPLLFFLWSSCICIAISFIWQQQREWETYEQDRGNRSRGRWRKRESSDASTVCLHACMPWASHETDGIVRISGRLQLLRTQLVSFKGPVLSEPNLRWIWSYLNI